MSMDEAKANSHCTDVRGQGREVGHSSTIFREEFNGHAEVWSITLNTLGFISSGGLKCGRALTHFWIQNGTHCMDNDNQITEASRSTAEMRILREPEMQYMAACSQLQSCDVRTNHRLKIAKW